MRFEPNEITWAFSALGEDLQAAREGKIGPGRFAHVLALAARRRRMEAMLREGKPR